MTRPTLAPAATVAPTYAPHVPLCRDASVDAAAALNSATYFFKGLFSSLLTTVSTTYSPRASETI